MEKGSLMSFVFNGFSSGDSKNISSLRSGIQNSSNNLSPIYYSYRNKVLQSHQHIQRGVYYNSNLETNKNVEHKIIMLTHDKAKKLESNHQQSVFIYV
jgi:hypothetical protein